MDCGSTYILMCQKAEEIQKQKSDQERAIPKSLISSDRRGDFFKENRIWLPRQDQLQAMIAHKGYTLSESLDWVCHFVMNEREFGRKYKSMEQLWLAFVMSQKFGKVWDAGKEEWVRSPVFRKDEERKISQTQTVAESMCRHYREKRLGHWECELGISSQPLTCLGLPSRCSKFEKQVEVKVW